MGSTGRLPEQARPTCGNPSRAAVEITGAILRLLPAGAPEGAPFSHALFVVGTSGTAIVKGLKADQPFTLSEAAAARRALRELGFTRAEWERHEPDGTVRTESTVL